MKKRSSLLISISILSLLLIFTCKKEKTFDRKSFVQIDNLNANAFAKDTAIITFNISNVEPNDSIISKEICFYPISNPADSQCVSISSLADNFIKLKDLESETTYRYQIRVMTEDEVNNAFFSVWGEFMTPGITVLIDETILVSEKELKMTAIGFIGDYEAATDSSLIETLGHRWTYEDNGVEVIVETFSEINRISNEGLFRSELYYFDFTKQYKIEAFVRLKAGPTVLSNNPLIDYTVESDGDFWVDIAALPYLDDDLSLINLPDPVFQMDIPPLEGAVSFRLDTLAYVGLGRTPSGSYPRNFYCYDSKRNRWSEIAPFPAMAGEGRMFAVSFVFDEKAYVGTGCRNCEGYDGYHTTIGDTLTSSDPSLLNEIRDIELLRDFYAYDPTTDSWQPAPELTLEDGRFGAYAFVTGNQVYIGGGLSKGPLKIDWNKDGIIDAGDWIDRNNNNQVEGDWIDSNSDLMRDPGECQSVSCLTFTGRWVDVNKNGIVDRPTEWIDNTILNLGLIPDKGDWIDRVPIDTFTDRMDWIDTDEEMDYDVGECRLSSCLTFTGRWVDVNKNGRVDFNNEWLDASELTLPIGTRDKGDWMDIDNDNVFDDSEWLDTNGDGEVDSTEVTFQLIVRTDLLTKNLNSTNPWASTGNINSNQRYGAHIWGLATELFLLGGDTIAPFNGANDVASCAFNGAGWECPASNLDAPSFSTRIFPIGFLLSIDGRTQAYVGGGELEEEDAIGFDLWEYKKDFLGTSSFRQVSGCGLNGLRRGIGFGLRDKGYIGFGIANNDKTRKEFWVYIPCLKDNDCN